MRTVEQLIADLSQYPSDLEVVMSKDEEGNGFSPYCEAEPAVYVPTSSYSGEVYSHGDEEDALENPNARNAVVLWPTN